MTKGETRPFLMIFKFFLPKNASSDSANYFETSSGAIYQFPDSGVYRGTDAQFLPMKRIFKCMYIIILRAPYY